MKNSFYKKAIEKVVENMNRQLIFNKNSCKKGRFIFEIGEEKLIEREDSYTPKISLFIYYSINEKSISHGLIYKTIIGHDGATISKKEMEAGFQLLFNDLIDYVSLFETSNKTTLDKTDKVFYSYKDILKGKAL